MRLLESTRYEASKGFLLPKQRSCADEMRGLRGGIATV